MPLVQERLKTLAEGPDLVSFFFDRPLEYDAALLVPKGPTPAEARRALVAALERLQGLESFDAHTLEEILRPLAEELDLKTGQLFGALRVATTGRTAAPPLFQTMEVLGRERCLQRLEHAITLLP